MNSTAAETSALLSILLRAMVKDRDAVTVTPLPGPGHATTFRVRVADKETCKIIGAKGRVARSLRILLTCIAKEHGSDFFLDVDNDSPGSSQARS